MKILLTLIKHQKFTTSQIKTELDKVRRVSVTVCAEDESHSGRSIVEISTEKIFEKFHSIPFFVPNKYVQDN